MAPLNEGQYIQRKTAPIMENRSEVGVGALSDSRSAMSCIWEMYGKILSSKTKNMICEEEANSRQQLEIEKTFLKRQTQKKPTYRRSGHVGDSQAKTGAKSMNHHGAAHVIDAKRVDQNGLIQSVEHDLDERHHQQLDARKLNEARTKNSQQTTARKWE